MPKIKQVISDFQNLVQNVLEISEFSKSREIELHKSDSSRPKYLSKLSNFPFKTNVFPLKRYLNW